MQLLSFTVLSFIRKLIEAGVEDDMVHSLVVFSLQYVLIDHEHWKFKVPHARWKVTLKVCLWRYISLLLCIWAYVNFLHSCGFQFFGG